MKLLALTTTLLIVGLINATDDGCRAPTPESVTVSCSFSLIDSGSAALARFHSETALDAQTNYLQHKFASNQNFNVIGNRRFRYEAVFPDGSLYNYLGLRYGTGPQCASFNVFSIGPDPLEAGDNIVVRYEVINRVDIQGSTVTVQEAYNCRVFDGDSASLAPIFCTGDQSLAIYLACRVRGHDIAHCQSQVFNTDTNVYTCSVV